MENEVFSLNRFWRYLKSDFDAFISRYGITLLVVSTMPITCDIFTGVFFSDFPIFYYKSGFTGNASGIRNHNDIFR